MNLFLQMHDRRRISICMYSLINFHVCIHMKIPPQRKRKRKNFKHANYEYQTKTCKNKKILNKNKITQT